MSIFTDKGIVQKIVIATVFVILFNFIVPNISFAKGDAATAGGILFEPIKDLLLVIGDGVMSILQEMILGMDVSFMTLTYKKASFWESFGASLGAIVGIIGGAVVGIVGVGLAPFTGGFSLGMVVAAASVIGTCAIGGLAAGVAGSYIASNLIPEKLKLPMLVLTPEEMFKNEIALLDVNFFSPKNDYNLSTQIGGNVEQTSIAITLGPIIFSWYYTLRNFAIIALLSILVYIGIRIVISSSAEDKAKYKQRLIDWLVAMCLLFFMHYIMAFAVTITEEITKAVSAQCDSYWIVLRRF